jgi:hypothetical protein
MHISPLPSLTEPKPSFFPYRGTFSAISYLLVCALIKVVNLSVYLGFVILALSCCFSPTFPS